MHEEVPSLKFERFVFQAPMSSRVCRFVFLSVQVSIDVEGVMLWCSFVDGVAHGFLHVHVCTTLQCHSDLFHMSSHIFSLTTLTSEHVQHAVHC